MPRHPAIIVIGAGIVGCSVAYELARRGRSVLVIDGRAAGMGATQASAGMLAPYIEAEGELLDLTVRSLNLFDEFVASVAGDSGVAIPYRRTGSLQVAVDAAGMAVLHSQASRLAAQDVACDVLGPASVRVHEPHVTGEVAGGVLVPAHGFVVVGELIRSLVAAARSHGAEFVEGRTVRRIAHAGPDGGGALVVETDGEPLSADRVVLAAGSWSSQIELAGVTGRIPVRPVRGQLLHLGWNGPRIRRVTWGPRCYLVPWDDGTVLAGATAEDVGFDERTTAAGVRDMLDAACELVPCASAATFLGARVGFRPASGDELPVIGSSRQMPGLMYACGHYRSGILLAPLTARLVADAIVDNRLDPAMGALSPDRVGDL